jgi:Multiubiquitin
MATDQKTHLFTITVNNQPFETSAHQLNGTQIKSLAGIPADYELFEVRGTETVPVTNDQVVHIHEKQEFRAIPAGTFGEMACAAAATR